MWDKPRRLVEGDKNSGFVQPSMEGLLNLYARQLLSDKSDLKCGEELIEAARV